MSSSGQWLQRQRRDIYVKQANRDGYRSRAAFKLVEIQQKDRLFKSGMTVVDLGAAPGGWSQVAKKYVGERGKVIAIDKLPILDLPGVVTMRGDFGDIDVYNQVMRELNGKAVDLVISDMAPNLTGNKHIDQPRAVYLAELALDFATAVLSKTGGSLLVKLFQGEDFDDYLGKLRLCFSKVTVRKPKASRERSREVYVVGKNFSS